MERWGTGIEMQLWMIAAVYGMAYIYDTRGKRHRNKWVAIAAVLPFIPP